MKEMCKKLTPYKCKQCGQDMLFFTTKSNMLIDYKGLFDRSVYGLEDITKYLENRHIRFIKCIVCNKTYVIDWTNGYPVPLLDKEEIKKFGV